MANFKKKLKRFKNSKTVEGIRQAGAETAQRIKKSSINKKLKKRIKTIKKNPGAAARKKSREIEDLFTQDHLGVSGFKPNSRAIRF